MRAEFFNKLMLRVKSRKFIYAENQMLSISVIVIVVRVENVYPEIHISNHSKDYLTSLAYSKRLSLYHERVYAALDQQFQTNKWEI